MPYKTTNTTWRVYMFDIMIAYSLLNQSYPTNQYNTQPYCDHASKLMTRNSTKKLDN